MKPKHSVFPPSARLGQTGANTAIEFEKRIYFSFFMRKYHAENSGYEMLAIASSLLSFIPMLAREYGESFHT
jgi:hypothetical protein